MKEHSSGRANEQISKKNHQIRVDLDFRHLLFSFQLLTICQTPIPSLYPFTLSCESCLPPMLFYREKSKLKRGGQMKNGRLRSTAGVAYFTKHSKFTAFGAAAWCQSFFLSCETSFPLMLILHTLNFPSSRMKSNFLNEPSHLYKRVCPSVCPSIRRSVVLLSDAC